MLAWQWTKVLDIAQFGAHHISQIKTRFKPIPVAKSIDLIQDCYMVSTCIISIRVVVISGGHFVIKKSDS